MTDARLAAAVEAAARAEFERGMPADMTTWGDISQAARDSWISDVETDQIEAALAAADAWDREHRTSPLDGLQLRMTDALARKATQEPQKPPLDGSAGSGGTPGPQVGDEGSGGES